MSETFKPATWSGLAVLWTASYLVALLYFLVRIGLAFSLGGLPEPFDLGFGVLLLILIGFAWARSVKGYRVQEGELNIDRKAIKSVIVPLNLVTSVQIDPSIRSFFNMSLLASGGVFGWGGRSGVRKTNEFVGMEAFAYGANPKSSVVIKANDGKTIIVTPADPEGLVAALRKADTRMNFITRVTSPEASKPKRKRGR